ncbi:MAG: hypothetical protein HC786_26970 [Richelia sp. CSU_2_1]|nr:hypothetical protein [Microcoleus sp. SU_5_3]NJR25521.1 hypothetical protein [Richelia sp. CSU_2_1]
MPFPYPITSRSPAPEDTALPCPYPGCNIHHRINCRETALPCADGSTPHAPTAVGNINSDATGINIGCVATNNLQIYDSIS